jgi:IS30 family transposase
MEQAETRGMASRTVARQLRKRFAVDRILNQVSEGRSGRKSVPFDNDTTFAQHDLLRSVPPNISTWFCDPYASWHKGGVDQAALPCGWCRVVHRMGD